jgi:hypothetical protein
MARGWKGSEQPFSFETRIVLLALLVGVPDSSAAMVLLWHDNHSITLRLILTVFILGLWVAQTFANWNRIATWLGDLLLLRQISALSVRTSTPDRLHGAELRGLVHPQRTLNPIQAC